MVQTFGIIYKKVAIKYASTNYLDTDNTDFTDKINVNIH